MNREKVTRVEVIDETGRRYVGNWLSNVMVDEQDEWRTLKVFVKKNNPSASDLDVDIVDNILERIEYFIHNDNNHHDVKFMNKVFEVRDWLTEYRNWYEKLYSEIYKWKKWDTDNYLKQMKVETRKTFKILADILPELFI